jgi:hypothetical protein
LHLDLFEQPARERVFGNLLVPYRRSPIHRIGIFAWTAGAVRGFAKLANTLERW